MKRTICLIVLLIAVLLISAAALARRERRLKLKAEIVTGVVIVHVQKDAKTLELQCNQGASDCKALQSGNYLMVEVPKNYGMYDCQNVEM